MLVLLDRQHGTKHARSWDPGAQADTDGDGIAESEAELTREYIAAAFGEVVGAGHDAEVYGVGTYTDRHRRAREATALVGRAPVAYVACHLNAGGGDYGLVCYRTEDAAGRAVAEAVGKALRQLPELRRVRVEAATSRNAWSNAWHAVRRAPPGAICFEPCFIDQPAHRALLSLGGLQRVGHALADGLLAWGAR